jgi:arylsulfatase A-like enzyme
MVAMGMVITTSARPFADGEDGGIRRVLLISIDGMHALDFENCANNQGNLKCPHLAALKDHGVNYTRTSTSRPSDSFPGLMALVTGGTPKTVGAYYDVAYDRVLAPPKIDTGNGNFKGTCTMGVPNGTTTEYEEGVDFDQSFVNGFGPGVDPRTGTVHAPFDGGAFGINPDRLPRDPFNNCLPVYPWNFIRANTIYGVIHAAGGYTAWSDKHAVYSAVSGPTGTDKPSNVNDYYAPDVNSNAVNIPPMINGYASTTAGTKVNCTNVLSDPNISDWTTSFSGIQCYDQMKVNAVLNWINGRTHTGAAGAPVPMIFGMNFQAVSVGQKLIAKKPTKIFGGYTDAAGTATAAMAGQIQFVDAAIGQMVDALRKADLLDSTAIIITAKHGQSPIDCRRFKEEGNTGAVCVGGGPGITTDPAAILAAAGYLPTSGPNSVGQTGSPENPNTQPHDETPCPPPFLGLGCNPATPGADSNKFGPIGPTQDDISLLWLADSNNTEAAVNSLEAQADAAAIGQIFFGPSIETMYNKPGLPKDGGDPRTPDIIVQPNVGTIYTTSGKKQEEHGGFAHDDTNVMLLVSNPHLHAKTVTTFVETPQVAPTILKLLGFDPLNLEAVQKEGTSVLPGLDLDQN